MTKVLAPATTLDSRIFCPMPQDCRVPTTSSPLSHTEKHRQIGASTYDPMLKVTHRCIKLYSKPSDGGNNELAAEVNARPLFRQQASYIVARLLTDSM